MFFIISVVADTRYFGTDPENFQVCLEDLFKIQSRSSVQ